MDIPTSGGSVFRATQLILGFVMLSHKGYFSVEHRLIFERSPEYLDRFLSNASDLRAGLGMKTEFALSDRFGFFPKRKECIVSNRRIRRAIIQICHDISEVYQMPDRDLRIIFRRCLMDLTRIKQAFRF